MAVMLNLFLLHMERTGKRSEVLRATRTLTATGVDRKYDTRSCTFQVEWNQLIDCLNPLGLVGVLPTWTPEKAVQMTRIRIQVILLAM